METTPSREEWNDWRWQLAHARRHWDPRNAATSRVESRYPFFATPYWLRLMEETGIPCGPAAMQAIPDERELSDAGECGDPFGESANPPLPGLVHRFPDRVLVIASLACAMRCRHCTRKNLLGVHSAPDMEGIMRNRTGPEDRLKFILASYNAGAGHVIDAIALARKYELDPRVWSENVEQAMLWKMDPEYYNDSVCSNGYCRGTEPVDYVVKVLNCYENYKKNYKK